MFKRSLLATFTVLSMSALAHAQGAPPDGGPGGGPGAFNPQQRMLDRLHDALEVEDEKWAQLEPKIRKVIEAQRAAQVGRGGPGGPGGGPPPGQGGPGGGGPGGGPDQGGGGPGGPPGGGPDGGPGGGPGGGGPGGPPETNNASEVQKAVMAIRELLTNSENPSSEEVTAKLTAFRAVLAKARASLADARKDLQAAVSPKQEAILVAMGVLE